MNLMEGTADSRALDYDVDPQQSLVDIMMLLPVKALNTVGGTLGECMFGKAVVHHLGCLC